MSKICKKCTVEKPARDYIKGMITCIECIKKKCPHCDKSFLANNLSRHIVAVHEQKMAWTCPRCNKSFKQKAYAIRHACLDENGAVIPERQHELIIQKRMERDTGYQPAHCMFGIVDLITPTEIIEIKNWFYWKHALGQIIAYLHCFPNLTPRLHFFGNKPANAELIIELLTGQGIIVTYE